MLRPVASGSATGRITPAILGAARIVSTVWPLVLLPTSTASANPSAPPSRRGGLPPLAIMNQMRSLSKRATRTSRQR